MREEKSAIVRPHRTFPPIITKTIGSSSRTSSSSFGTSVHSQY